jgi:uncharacterized protein involved in cysteine biosynthesis
LVWLAVGVGDLILALDFVFKLLASANVGFVSFISMVAGSLAAPFRGVLASSVPSSGRYLYWPDVVAIVVFLIAAWIVVRLIGITAGRRSS